MSSIAGHTFNPWTDRCTGVVDGAVCGKRWLDIAHVDESYIGEKGIAHIGELNRREVDEIAAERDRRRAVFEAAISGRVIRETVDES